MGRRPLSTYETVLIETPAARATSLIVGIAPPPLPVPLLACRSY
jgi:hypothetical protein